MIVDDVTIFGPSYFLSPVFDKYLRDGMQRFTIELLVQRREGNQLGHIDEVHLGSPLVPSLDIKSHCSPTSRNCKLLFWCDHLKETGACILYQYGTCRIGNPGNSGILQRPRTRALYHREKQPDDLVAIPEMYERSTLDSELRWLKDGIVGRPHYSAQWNTSPRVHVE